MPKQALKRLIDTVNDKVANPKPKSLSPLWGLLFLIVGVGLALGLAHFAVGTESATPSERSDIIATILGALPGIFVAAGGLMALFISREGAKVKETQVQVEEAKTAVEASNVDTAAMKEEVIKTARIVGVFAKEMAEMKVQLEDSHSLLEQTKKALDGAKGQNLTLLEKIEELTILNSHYQDKLKEAHELATKEKAELTKQIESLRAQVDELLRKVAAMESK